MASPVRGAALRRALARANARDVREIRALPGLATVAVPAGRDATAYARGLAARSDVRSAEPDVRVRTATVPDDPFLSEQYALHNTGQLIGGFATGTPDADIDAPEAWNLTTGSSDIVVAVPDTGIAAGHPELAGQLAENAGEVGGGRESNGVDDDANGFVDDWRGWDFVDDDADPADLGLFPHGTAVAGTIAARAGNAIGVSGVAPGVRVLALRIANRGGTALASDIIDAFAYAAASGARIVNLSFEPLPFISALRDAITAAPNVLLVNSAGNASADLDAADRRYPCAFGLANVVCVAATDDDDALAGFSSTGAANVDLAAPGVGVLTTSPAYEQLLDEDFEQPLAGRWTVGGTNASWGLTTSRHVSGAASLADSPAGDYLPDTDSTIARDAGVDLTGRRGCRVEYRANLESESGHDRFEVQLASGPSSPFQTLNGWTGSSSGAFARLESDAWSHEGLADVRLRFRMLSDAAIQADGVYLDDVTLSCLADAYAGRELLYADGTSFSAPIVSAIAALVWSLAPDLTAAGVRAALRTGVDPVPALAGKVSTGGRANALRALHAIAPLASSGPASSDGFDVADLTGTAVPRGREAEVWFDYGPTAAYGARTNVLVLSPVSGEQPVSALVTGLSALTTDHYRLAVRTATATAFGADRTVRTLALPPVPEPDVDPPPPPAPEEEPEPAAAPEPPVSAPPRLSAVKVGSQPARPAGRLVRRIRARDRERRRGAQPRPARLGAPAQAARRQAADRPAAPAQGGHRRPVRARR